MKDRYDKHKSRRNRATIREIFMREWDSIGFRDVPEAQDEYDSYVAETYVMLIDRGATTTDLCSESKPNIWAWAREPTRARGLGEQPKRSCPYAGLDGLIGEGGWGISELHFPSLVTRALVDQLDVLVVELWAVEEHVDERRLFGLQLPIVFG